MAKKSGFKMRSGNQTSFKMMGSSPLRDEASTSGLLEGMKAHADASNPEKKSIVEHLGEGVASIGRERDEAKFYQDLYGKKNDDDDDDDDKSSATTYKTTPTKFISRKGRKKAYDRWQTGEGFLSKDWISKKFGEKTAQGISKMFKPRLVHGNIFKGPVDVRGESVKDRKYWKYKDNPTVFYGGKSFKNPEEYFKHRNVEDFGDPNKRHTDKDYKGYIEEHDAFGSDDFNPDFGY